MLQDGDEHVKVSDIGSHLRRSVERPMQRGKAQRLPP